MGQLLTPFNQFFDDDGAVLSNGWLTFYESGTNVIKQIYADDDLTVALTNPLQLDADARCPAIYGEGAYRTILSEDNNGIPGTQLVAFETLRPVLYEDSSSLYNWLWGSNIVVLDPTVADHASSSYTNSLKSLVTAAAGKPLSVVVVNTRGASSTLFNLLSSYTVPSNVTIRQESGAVFNIPTGVTLTINGGFESGLSKCFALAGTGKVDFQYNNLVRYGHVEWWGAVSDSTTDSQPYAQAAVDSGLKAIRMTNSADAYYVFENPLTLPPSRFELDGGYNKAEIRAGDSFPGAGNYRGVIEIAPDTTYLRVVNIKIRGGLDAVRRADYGVLTPINGDATDDRKHVTIDGIDVYKVNKACLAICAWMSSVRNCRVNGNNVAMGYYHGGITINGVTSAREGTTTVYENNYALECAESAYFFDTIAGLTVNSCAADSNLIDGTYALRITSSVGVVNGFDAEYNARALIMTDGSNNVTMIGARFVHLAPATIGVTQNDLIQISSNGQLTLFSSDFSADGSPDYTNFLNLTGTSKVFMDQTSTNFFSYANSYTRGQIVYKGYTSAVRARRSSGQTILNATPTTVLFDNVSTLYGFDYEGRLNTSTGEYTADTDGLFSYRAVVGTTASVDQSYLQADIALNGGTIDTRRVPASGTSGLRVSISGFVEMSKGDTLKVVAEQNSGVSQTLNGGTNGCLFMVKQEM